MVQHWRLKKWYVDYVITDPDEIIPENKNEFLPPQSRKARAIQRHESNLRSSHPVMELHEAMAPFDGNKFDAFNAATDALKQPDGGGDFFHFDGFETKFLGRYKCPPFKKTLC